MTAASLAVRVRLRKPEPLHRQTGSRIHHSSVARRDRWWQHFSADEAKRHRLAFNLYAESRRRKKGQRMGSIGTLSRGARDLHQLLLNLAVRGSGRLEPSLEYLAEKIDTSIKVIHGWLKQLRAFGFLRWTRRYVETGRPGLRGPQVEQTTNAYQLVCPSEANQLAAAKLGPAEDAADKAERLRRQGSPLMSSIDRLGFALQDDHEKRAGAQGSNVIHPRPMNPD